MDPGIWQTNFRMLLRVTIYNGSRHTNNCLLFLHPIFTDGTIVTLNQTSYSSQEYNFPSCEPIGEIQENLHLQYEILLDFLNYTVGKT